MLITGLLLLIYFYNLIKNTMKILYGVDNHYIDVTYLAFKHFSHNGILHIPKNDNEKAAIFSDPIFGTLKHIKIMEDETKSKIYPEEVIIQVDHIPIRNKFKYSGSYNSPQEKLIYGHRNLSFLYGNIKNEYPEQLLVAEFLPRDAKVLEIGAGIGRNTLNMASILANEKYLVAVECNVDHINKLTTNRDINNYEFNIEPYAISNQRLFLKGINTYDEKTRPADAIEVATITWATLAAKYDFHFDTLVADCEGALYYILKDTPEMMNNIKLVIVENDYTDLQHKKFMDDIFSKYGLKVCKQVPGGWGPCQPCFYEVWIA